MKYHVAGERTRTVVEYLSSYVEADSELDALEAVTDAMWHGVKNLSAEGWLEAEAVDGE